MDSRQEHRQLDSSEVGPYRGTIAGSSLQPCPELEEGSRTGSPPPSIEKQQFSSAEKQESSMLGVDVFGAPPNQKEQVGNSMFGLTVLIFAEKARGIVLGLV